MLLLVYRMSRWKWCLNIMWKRRKKGNLLHLKLILHDKTITFLFLSVFQYHYFKYFPYTFRLCVCVHISRTMNWKKKNVEKCNLNKNSNNKKAKLRANRNNHFKSDWIWKNKKKTKHRNKSIKWLKTLYLAEMNTIGSDVCWKSKMGTFNSLKFFSLYFAYDFFFLVVVIHFCVVPILFCYLNVSIL